MNCTSPTDLEYSDMEYFECPYNHECTDCEFDCGDDEVC